MRKENKIGKILRGLFTGCLGIAVPAIIAVVFLSYFSHGLFEGFINDKQLKPAWFPYFYEGKYYKMERHCITADWRTCFLAPQGHPPYDFSGEAWFAIEDNSFDYFDQNKMLHYTKYELEEKGYTKKEIVEEYLKGN